MQLVPFGKYKGQPVESLVNDRQYCEWLLEQPWFAARFGPIHTLVINNFGEASETPEHNQLQALFTDPEFCREFLLEVYRGEIDSQRKAIKETRLEDLAESLERRQYELEQARRDARWRFPPREEAQPEEIERDVKVEEARARYCALAGKIDAAREAEAELGQITAAFEVDRADVLLEYRIRLEGKEGNPHQAYVECKPTLGDDYPAVLRSMAATRSRLSSYNPPPAALLVGPSGFAANGATIAQVAAIFRSRQIRIAFLTSLEKPFRTVQAFNG